MEIAPDAGTVAADGSGESPALNVFCHDHPPATPAQLYRFNNVQG